MTRRCAHMQCDRPRREAQLCHAHYMRMVRGSSIATPVGQAERPRTRGWCSRSGCTLDHVAHGLCRKHYDQVRYERPLTCTPDAQSIELDLDLGIPRTAIAADYSMRVGALTRWLRSNGRTDLVERLLGVAA